MLAACIIGIASAAIGQTSNLTYDTTYTDGLSYPARVAPAGGGGVYVTDQQSGKIVELDAVGTAVNTYNIPELPVGIAVHPSGDVFISRVDGHVGRYDASFVFQETLDPAPAALEAPTDLVVHPITGELYVVDNHEHQILVFAGNGGGWALDRAWGTEGNGLAEMMTPQAIALDTALDLVIVADTDNFRGQVFDTAGMLVRKFGYRTSYVGMNAVAWVARAAGVAVDSCSNIYLTDALMGTVRAFDSTGQDLDLANPPIGYGANPGELRNPCGLMIESGKLYVASTYNAAVEVFDVACTAGGGRPEGGSIDDSSATALESTRKVSRQRVRLPDDPMDIVRAMDEDAYSAALDLNKDRSVDTADLEIAVAKFGAATVDDFLDPSASNLDYPGPLQAPHMIDIPNVCGRCHSMDGLPGGMLSVDGQENLCLSCHTSGGVAMHKAISRADIGNSHPRGMAADSGDVLGPDPDSINEIALHLDNGNVRCGTCHNPMTSDAGSPYLRDSIGDAALCGECHVQGAQWALAGHSHGDSRAFNYPVGPGREACARCHSGLGHIDFAAGVPQAERRTDKQVHSCFVCHGVHENSNEHLLRIFDEVEMPWGEQWTGLEHNANCIACHNGRYLPNTGHTTPHYLPGGVVLFGLNGIDFGNTIDMSAHAVVVGCAECHMAETPGTPKDGVQDPGEDKVGGHTFNLVYHDETGEDPDDGFENTENACGTCHPGLLTVNRPAWGDYDGSGVTDGIQDELTGLLAAVHTAIEDAGAVDLGSYPYWSFSGVDPLVEQTVRDAVWNYALIKNDGSLGVHNVGFCVGLLQATYRELTGTDVPGASLRYTFGPNARRGGLLYDKWWAVNGAAEPTGDHPLYPPIGQKSGSTTYRCKECHGWDYIGDLGRYESGSHYTGIMGVLNAAANWTDAELFDIIKDPDGDGTGGTTVNGHDFGTYGLSDFDIQDLVEFLTTEVIDTSPYIDRLGVPGAYTYDFIGDVGNGFGYFSGALNVDSACYVCHGTDGRAIEFHAGEFLGTLADDNPQEVLHKIRFGQPATMMPSAVNLALAAQDAADIGAYAETLPQAAAVGGDTVRGGLLYDKWWKVNGAAEPTGDHPLYPPIGQKSGSTTYRCKECHGWDYIGDLGRYESGSHYTGIIGVIDATTNWTDAELFDIIKNPDGDGTGGTTVNGHDMGTYGLSDTDIDDMVGFLNNGVVDTGPYINRGGVAGSYTYSFNGDSVAGATLYSGGVDPVANCSLCHGADGQTIEFHENEFLGDLARDNPQETLHKIRLGQPAAGMCSYVRQGLTDQQAADTGTYCETLP